MRIFLAPMEGVVDHHLRKILSTIGGIDLCVTEFIRVSQAVLPKRVFLKSSPELNNDGEGALCPTRIQLLGCDPELLAENAKVASTLGAPAIDLNFGCPAKTVNRNRGGACLLDEPTLLFDIVNAVRKAVPNDIPVTAKIRLGFNDRSSYLTNAHAIESAGANELVVHARSKADGYRPPAYWEYIGEINDALSIPVVANGDIWTLEDYKRCKDVSNCQDVMLGRGLLAQPDLALAIKAHESGLEYTPYAWADVATHLKSFLDATAYAYAPKYLGNRVKQWLFYLKRHYGEAEELFETIKRSHDYHFIARAICRYIPEHSFHEQNFPEQNFPEHNFPEHNLDENALCESTIFKVP